MFLENLTHIPHRLLRFKVFPQNPHLAYACERAIPPSPLGGVVPSCFLESKHSLRL